MLPTKAQVWSRMRKFQKNDALNMENVLRNEKTKLISIKYRTPEEAAKAKKSLESMSMIFHAKRVRAVTDSVSALGFAHKFCTQLSQNPGIPCLVTHAGSCYAESGDAQNKASSASRWHRLPAQQRSCRASCSITACCCCCSGSDCGSSPDADRPPQGPLCCCPATTRPPQTPHGGQSAAAAAAARTANHPQ